MVWSPVTYRGDPQDLWECSVSWASLYWKGSREDKMKEGCWTPNSTGKKQANKTTQLQICAVLQEKGRMTPRQNLSVRGYSHEPRGWNLKPQRIIPRPEIQRHLPCWILKLQQTRDSFLLLSSFWNRNVYNSYTRLCHQFTLRTDKLFFTFTGPNI